MIACWKIRRTISNCVDAGVSLPAATQEHIAHCSACRDQYQSESAIARQLAADAAAHKREVSPFLHAKIMASIHNPQHETVGYRSRLAPFWSLALGTACVLLAGIVWLRNPALLHPPTPHLANNQKPAATESALAIEWPKQFALRDLPARLDEPLETEMDRVVKDTRTAMNSLADNFLPEPLRASLLAKVRSREL